MVLLKVMGALAGATGCLLGVVGYFARRKAQRRQEALLLQMHQVQLQQNQLLTALDASRGTREQTHGKVASHRDEGVEMNEISAASETGPPQARTSETV